MLGESLGWLLAAAGSILAVLVVQTIYFAVLCAWSDRATNGKGYFGRPLRGRRRFKRMLAWLVVPARPLLWLLSRVQEIDLKRATFTHAEVAAPRDACDQASFRRAAEYQPGENDIFVVTQMKCGTTWMQHLVYQVLNRGNGDLVETGQALYAVSPWIESRKSVSLDDAPLLGRDVPRRIIKTHLPVHLCPFSERARYIYVARHPVSCFASTVDFLRSNLGPFEVSLGSLEQWFCSPQMWWGPWPDHVHRWWEWSQQKPHVLFMRFEDMKHDLFAATRQVAEFLDVSHLTDAEMERIVHKCSFQYMRDNWEAFEMSVPTVLNCRVQPFVSGSVDRHRSVPDDVRERLLRWAEESLEAAGISLDRFYPEAVCS